MPPFKDRVAIYGHYATGKTAESLSAFPGALFIGADRSIETVARNVLGIREGAVEPLRLGEREVHYPRMHHPVADAYGLMGALEKLLQHPDRLAALPAVVIDDESLLWSAIMQGLEAKYPVKKEGVEGIDNFKVYGELKRHVDYAQQLLNEIARYTAVVEGFHERGVSFDEKNKTRWKGSPMYPSKKRAVECAKHFGLIFRLITDGRFADPWHAAAYQTTEDYDYIGKCRLDYRGIQPGNLRALLWCAPQPVKLERLPGLEWQDEVMEQVAELLADPATRKNAQTVTEALQVAASSNPSWESLDFLHWRWAVRDGVAIAAIRQTQQAGRAAFFSAPTAKGKPAPPPPGRK